MTGRLRVLVTNDDGVKSPGIRHLAEAIVKLGHEVVVAAPLDDRSGIGTALYSHNGRPVETRTLKVDDLPDVPFNGIDGTPALAVTMAQLGAFGPRPWCVVAGINHGVNTGRSILHSGTVGAALTAAALGMSGMAVSIDARAPRHLSTAAGVAAEATQWLTTARKRTVLNLNVPDVPANALRGARWGRLAAFGRSKMTTITGPDGKPSVTVTASPLAPDPETDEGLVAAGYVSVTQITGVQAVQDDAAALHLNDRLTALRAGNP